MILEFEDFRDNRLNFKRELDFVVLKGKLVYKVI